MNQTSRESDVKWFIANNFKHNRIWEMFPGSNPILGFEETIIPIPGAQ